MGMFDSVMIDCPKCGKPMEFQSKAGGCGLDVFTLENAPSEVLMDIMNEPQFHRACGEWVALVDPKFPPPYRPRPDLRPRGVKPPDLPPGHKPEWDWWPYETQFTFSDLKEPIEQL